VALGPDIERALDDLVFYEEGMKFQALAVVLAKKRWPDLIACEPKKDLGADAIAKPAFSAEGDGKVLACSITAELGKVRDDAQKIKDHYKGIDRLIFATPAAVSNEKGEAWAAKIQREFGYQLVIMSRQDIVTSLLDPTNVSLLKNHLGIHVEVEASLAELVEHVRAAASDVNAGWLRRISNRPLIELHALKLDSEGKDTNEVLQFASICEALGQSRRVVLEGPAGRGKTTTLAQIATNQSPTGISLLIDLPAWTESNSGILEFISGMPQFQSRSMDATALARVGNVEHLSFLLNGWNEVAESNSRHAETALRGLDRDFPTAGILVATRTHHLLPPLLGAVRARLLPLTRAERIAYLDARLGGRAGSLCKRLDTDRVLDDLTRTPLFLSEVTTLFEADTPIPSTKLGVLDAVMSLVERSEEHQNPLRQAPLAGRARDYVGALATQMTMKGRVSVPEEEARSAVSSVAVTLKDTGQMGTLPDGADVLNALCAHHILERQEYPAVAFRFEHQQFQEFYAAVNVRRQLSDLVKHGDEDRKRQFMKTVINEPAWAEPLGMIAEEIGHRPNSEGRTDVVSEGKLLVTMALYVDPVFAAELARFCGVQVWQEVRTDVSNRLRSLYAVRDSRYRRIALAGMLASGSEDFKDIIVPIFSSSDQQSRLGLYRTWGFHLSCLGPNWRETVSEWPEEARVNFVSEILHQRYVSEIAPFAESDPSVKVREAAIRGLCWIGAEDEAAQLLQSLDPNTSESVLQEFQLRLLPRSVRESALAASERAFEVSDDTWKRIGLLLRQSALGTTKSAELKGELGKVTGKIDDHQAHFVVKPALEIVQAVDPECVSAWVAGRVAAGSLWHDTWMKLITTVPADLKEALVHRLETEDFLHEPHGNIIRVLTIAADAALAQRVFLKLCELRGIIRYAPDERHEFEWAVERQLEDLLRALPVNVAVSGFSDRFSKAVNGVELDVITRIFSKVGHVNDDPLAALDATTRANFRGYIRNALPVVLQEADFSGELKANTNSVLASIGTPEDLTEMRRLIQADIERFRKAMALRASGDRSRAANPTSYAMWHVRAVMRFDPEESDSVLFDLLNHPEYERSVVEEVARQIGPRMRQQSFVDKVDYEQIWQARSGVWDQSQMDRRRRFATAIRERIATIFAERAGSKKKRPYEFRLRILGLALATIDGHGSSDVVLEVMSIPDEWDVWTRIRAFEELLFEGVTLPLDRILSLLDSFRERLRRHGFQQDDHSTATRLLCLLPFVDDPSTGIETIRQVTSELRIYAHHLRGVAEAVGHCRCDRALAFLRELAADKAVTQQLADAWIRAVAAIDTAESRALLLSFIDPRLSGLPIEAQFGRDDVLVACIVDLMRRDKAVEANVVQLCGTALPSRNRMLLAKVVGQLAGLDAVSAGLNLIDDTANPSIPYEIRKQLEDAFIEKRPVAGHENTYTLEPRGSNAIRTILLEMSLTDARRKKSAARLLAEIEEWRLEYGRPVGEPRHPALEAGRSWPPVQEAALFNAKLG
jgi:NACHT C-terminal Alpha/Beta 2